ncbi:NADP-dependent malic enzyme [Acuticoccus mangrovi]|uniref:NADP-dependent malic enzyme n=1 Tax=Acuticoccus mangrovi TaxID=2796142 RepID=A0A934MDS2_9HYPH|nr:NADP-dependent malic enzyme [Acuticoccus mangrovi]MBJ3776682.1 NADP-dependent malic enzyme [Acuticoccus mangrovi]
MTDEPTSADESALAYHRLDPPGKLEIRATKPLSTQRDLSLAYSPGVAAPSLAIAKDPLAALDYTARGNVVAVVTNGTAVLGLGAIGPLASKPVMEGKAVLFKKFANIDGIDIEVDELDPDKFVDIVAALEPSFGGINLEDIRAPECFLVEEALKARMGIPVFHDDQHGTAIIVSAAVKNGLMISDKSLADVRIVTAGAGAAALSCLNLLVTMGARPENIIVTDLEGVVYEGREALMDPWKAKFARKTELRTLAEAIDGADIFLGLSAAGVLKPEMLKKMAQNPMVLALANPNPEIMPEVVAEVRPDALVCTGRSDYPNQVNNVICFPYLFRGALDVGATEINETMKVATAEAIAALARERPTEEVAKAYGGAVKTFGPEYLIPAPFDPRLILRIAPAVAKAAQETGVAQRPITDMAAYRDRLNRFVFRSGSIMKPVFEKASQSTARVVYAEGEDERVLRAAEIAIEEGIGVPILIGRRRVVEARARRAGLKRVPFQVEIIDPEDDPRYRDYVEDYFALVGRRGITPEAARTVVRTNTTVIAALAVKRGEADAMLCGVESPFNQHVKAVRDVIGLADGVTELAALSLLLSDRRATFLLDTQVCDTPTASQIAEMTLLACDQLAAFGISPRVALLSASRFGSRDIPSAVTMREALARLNALAPNLEVDGEMNGEDALNEAVRLRAMPDSPLKGEANLLVFPTIDASHIAMTLLKEITGALHVGPILLGTRLPAHIVTQSSTARGVLNMTALAVVDVANRVTKAAG